MNKGLKSLNKYWDIESKNKTLNPHIDTFFDGELNNWQSLKVAVVFSVLAIAIIIFWSIIGVIL